MGRDAPQGAGTVTAEFTVEQAAEVLRDLPEDLPHESVARIMTSTLKAADIEVEQLLRSSEERETELQANIERGQQTVAELERETEETIRSLEEQIAQAREARDTRVQEEQQNIEDAQSNLADLQHVRYFLAPPEQEEPQETRSLPGSEADETPLLPEPSPIDDGEAVEVADEQAEPATEDSSFKVGVRVFRFRHGLHTTILVSTLLGAGAVAYLAMNTTVFAPNQPKTDTASESPASDQQSETVTAGPLTDESVELIFEKNPSPSLATPSGTVDYGGRIALTFDDGPDPKVTPAILDTLAEHNLKATFFVNGEKASKHPQLIRRIVQEGHTLGNHTYDHQNMAQLSPAQMRRELRSTQQAVDRALGRHYEMKLMRPPFGEPYYANQNKLSSFRAIVRNLKAIPVLWTIDSRDWAYKGQPRSIVRNVAQRTDENGGVLLLHDTNESTAKALPGVIARYEKEGFAFTSVPELLADKYSAPSASANTSEASATRGAG